MTTGRVMLIGAGPGDVELLTLKAVRALQRADIALIDDLVNREVLQFLKPGTRVIEVGKRGWKGRCGRSTSQVLIERLMLRYAQRGLCVARIKGGDPFVFGRGGEETATLAAAGIAVEVVSGITAGLAVPAALGIPVTHRDFTQGVTLVTGQSRSGKAPDWRALAAGGTTLVIYMGMANLPHIVASLIEAGMAADTPVAVIQQGTLPTQRAVQSTLAAIAAAVEAAGIGSPAIVIVGAVAALARPDCLDTPQTTPLQHAA